MWLLQDAKNSKIFNFLIWKMSSGTLGVYSGFLPLPTFADTSILASAVGPMSDYLSGWVAFNWQFELLDKKYATKIYWMSTSQPDDIAHVALLTHFFFYGS